MFRHDLAKPLPIQLKPNRAPLTNIPLLTTHTVPRATPTLIRLISKHHSRTLLLPSLFLYSSHLLSKIRRLLSKSSLHKILLIPAKVNRLKTQRNEHVCRLSINVDHDTADEY